MSPRNRVTQIYLGHWFLFPSPFTTRRARMDTGFHIDWFKNVIQVSGSGGESQAHGHRAQSMEIVNTYFKKVT
jgi:hypothetical protein